MTNIPKPVAANNSDFVVGDTVVFIDSSKPDHLMTVTQVQKNGVLLGGNSNFALDHLVRHATTMELEVKKRLPIDDHIRHYFEATHYEHFDLHYVYALGEYSDAKTQAKWSEFQGYCNGAVRAQGEVA